MPGVIVTETLHVDTLPGIWSPVQWELTEEERATELEDQAQASLLAAVDVPEALLRLLLDETEIVRLFEPPEGFDPERQGLWDDSLVTFAFKRPIKLEALERGPDRLTASYRLEGAGTWQLEISGEKVVIERI